MPKKLNQAEVVVRFRKAHGDRYDYSRVVYAGTATKVTCICAKHGEFEIVPTHHMNGTGCRKCYDDRQRLTRDEFIRRSCSHHGDRYEYHLVPDPFPGSVSKLPIRCLAHSRVFQQEAKAHMSGHTGCPECRSDLVRGPLGTSANGSDRADPTSVFVTKARASHGDRYDYTSTVYSRSHDKIWIRCHDHGTFAQTPANHLQGRGCPECGRAVRRKGSLKERCAELGLNYHRILKRVQAGILPERALREGYIRSDKETAAAQRVGVKRYPNRQEACRVLNPPASPTTILRWIRSGMPADEAFVKDPKPGFARGMIYKVTQISTGKIYVGQTIQKCNERWQSHLEQAAAGRIEAGASLHHAIRTCGEGDFRIVAIEEVKSAIELSNREKHWIDELGTLTPDGFNLNRGGSTGGSLKKPYDVDGQRFESRGSAAKHIARTRGIGEAAAKKRLENGRIDVKAPAKAGETRTKTKEYKAWSAMKDAVSPRSRAYQPGLELHVAWRQDFDVWLTEAGMAPSPEYRFARIDKRKGFVPGNCVWMTPAEDAKARATSGRPLFGGVKPRHSRNSDVGGRGHGRSELG